MIFEFTEQEEVIDNAHLSKIVSDYQQRGFLTAIDDFGSGFSGLKLLCDVNVDAVKIDRGLIQDIYLDLRRQRILRHLFGMLSATVNRVVVEGVEMLEELKALYSIGFRYFQGYYFEKPGFESLPTIDFCALRDELNETKKYP